MNGKIYIIGIGPGFEEYIIPKAINALNDCDVIVGYKTYIDLIRPFVADKQLVSSGMMKEVERCKEVLSIAQTGKKVGLVSSGDAGIYGMAGIMLEIVAHENADVEVEVVPGISAAVSAASLLGAPLMNDFVTMSLSDLMTPWEVIMKRLEAACMGDFVIALYNPRSKKRIEQLDITLNLIMKYYSPQTPVGIVKHAMRAEQEVEIVSLDAFPQSKIDMFTTLIIGNSQTSIVDGKMVTRRGYKIN